MAGVLLSSYAYALFYSHVDQLLWAVAAQLMSGNAMKIILTFVAEQVAFFYGLRHRWKERTVTYKWT